MIEFNQLEQLIAIVDEGTISRAAEKLLISQPALTRSLQRLEDELELSLFDRQKNRIILNENGKLAVQYARKILEETSSMVEELRAFDRRQRTVSIGSCAPAPIWGLQEIFSDDYPQMNILDDLNDHDQELIHDLLKKKHSVIVLNHPMDDDKIICDPLFSEHLYLSVPPAHPLAVFKEISFEELDGESILLLSRIGFWSEVCQKHLSHSHLLYQDDASILNEIIKASALPTFRTDITINRLKDKENRIYIPITNISAKVQYYICYLKENRKQCH